MSVTVLCVHEDRSLAAANAEALEAAGYEVLVAHDGRGTFELLRRHQPDFVALDAYLPRQDGFEILAEMRAFEVASDTAVLLLCEGDVTDEISARAKSLGAVGVESSSMGGDELASFIAGHVKPASTSGSCSAPVVGETGRLRDIPFPELMHSFRVAKTSGVLLLEHGKKRKAIEFRDGWPAAVKSNLVSECLGHYLVREGRVTQEEFDESVSRMRAGEGLQGQILVAMDVLDEESMIEVLRAHALDKFYEVFSWRDACFALKSSAHVQRGSSLGLDGHPAALIVEGVRRRYPIKQIDRYIDYHADEFLVPIEAGEEQLAEVGLTTEERAFIAQLDGATPLSAVSTEPEWVRRLVFALVSIEFLGVMPAAGDATDSRMIAARVASGASTPHTTESVEDERVRSELAEIANRIRNKDHFGVLDVPRTADDEEIRVSYAWLAKKTHPDRFHGASASVRQLAAQVFERVAEAHAAIATAADRESYAKQLAQGRRLEAVESEGRRALAAETEFQKGEAKMAARDYEGALLNFGRAMENFPSEGEYRSHYGWCLYLCHPDNDVMMGEALEHCREGLKLAKDREKPYLLLGRLYKAMGKAVAAKKMFSRAVQIKPQCVEAMRELRIMNMRREATQGLGKGVLKKIFRR